MIDLRLFSTIYSQAVLLPGIAVATRRMHDVEKSGWYCLIPIYNIILACTEGDKGPILKMKIRLDNAILFQLSHNKKAACYFAAFCVVILF